MANTSKKATRSVAIATAHLIYKGWEVAVPVDPTSVIDLIARNPRTKEWENIQVKSFYRDRGSMVANLCRTTRAGRKPYGAEEVDWYVLVLGAHAILLPRPYVGKRTRISFNVAQKFSRAFWAWEFARDSAYISGE